MKVLITGSTGFLGQAVMRQLGESNVTAHAVSTRGERPGVEAVDFADPHALRAMLDRVGPTHVLHLSGALEGPGLAGLATANLLHGAALLDAAKVCGFEAPIMMVGSAAEYGVVPADQNPVAEDRAAAPVAPYGITKLAQTRLALASGLPVVIARPANIIGPGMPTTLALGRFASELARWAGVNEADRILRVGDLSAVRDLIDVEDAARILLRLVATPAAIGSVVNVGTGVGLSMRDALNGIVDAGGLAVQVREDGPGSARSGTASVFVADTTRLRRLIGPYSFIPAADTFQRMAAWIRHGSAM